MIKRTVLTLSGLWLIQGCTPHIKKEESAFIVFKTPSVKYADMGFVRDSSRKLEVDMYSAGQPLVSIEVNALNVCMSTFKCMEKKKFNKKILSSSYPETLLENVFKAQPIFNKEGYEQTDEGFTQKLKKENGYDITYSVVRGNRTFRDTINNILIKVREQ